MKKYAVTLRGHYEKTISVYADTPEEAKKKTEIVLIMRELSAIGNRINQLAAKANALNFIDTPMLREEARKWHDFQLDVRKKYLLPRKVS